MPKVMWSFKTKHFTVQWLIERDVLNTSHMDPDLAKECRAGVRSGKLKCFASEIRVVHTASKIALGASYLGNSIYENPAAFRDHFGMTRNGHGSYFSDMVREAIAEARKNFASFQGQARRDIKEKQKILAIQLKATEPVSSKSTV